ncbi:ComF family protein [Amnibacterium flavum]|uniref:Phosphoribosyltransferase domain-containing protein n=1 Tax=Amnibacterium flavum TaxID=2173173 RepID=A0A2V1HTL7_9MICO|nr:phosphoribosyltransferase family protein [Amnibacterium flavum]PVZ95935.1 hypothetical protein DDQ50_05595 [Amnibacterium flavum]
MGTPVRSIIAEAVLDALALVLPVRCSGCGAPDRAVCEDCRRLFVGGVLRRETEGLPVFSAAPYGGATARILASYKDGGRLDAAPALGSALRHVLTQMPAPRDGPVLLVPVPTTRAAVRRRGVAPLEGIARAARVPFLDALAVGRRVVDQSRLGASDRAENLAGAFRARRPLPGAQVVLLDDIVTTGATLREAARALGEAGALVQSAVTLAATPRHHAPPTPLHQKAE